MTDRSGQREQADRFAHEAGCRYQAGDTERAAQLIGFAKSLDPDREELWAQRDEQILAKSRQLPLAVELKTRMAAAGLNLETDPGLAQIREWNRQVYKRHGVDLDLENGALTWTRNGRPRSASWSPSPRSWGDGLLYGQGSVRSHARGRTRPPRCHWVGRSERPIRWLTDASSCCTRNSPKAAETSTARSLSNSPGVAFR